MLTQDDKQYLHKTFATKDDLTKLEAKLDKKLDRKLGVYHEEVLSTFQHFAEMIMSHIDKKFEVVTSHEKRLNKLDADIVDLRLDRTLHHKRISSLEQKSK